MSCSNKTKIANQIINQMGAIPVTGGGAETNDFITIKSIIEKDFDQQDARLLAELISKMYHNDPYAIQQIVALDVMISTGKNYKELKELALGKNDPKNPRHISPHIAYHIATRVDRSLDDPDVYEMLKQDGEALLAAVIELKHPLNDDIRRDICQKGQALALMLYEGVQPATYEAIRGTPAERYYWRIAGFDVPEHSIESYSSKKAPNEWLIIAAARQMVAQDMNEEFSVLSTWWSPEFYIERYRYKQKLDYIYNPWRDLIRRRSADFYFNTGIQPHFVASQGGNTSEPDFEKHVKALYPASIITHLNHRKSGMNTARLTKSPLEWRMLDAETRTRILKKAGYRLGEQ